MHNRVKTALDAVDGCRELPLFCFVVLPTLLVRARFITVAPDAAWLWPWPEFGDTRSWWKAAFVVGIGLWMAAHAAARLASGRRPVFRRYGALTVLAMLATLASALLSDFPRTAWLGYTSLYEGALVLLAYLLAAWYAAEATESPAARLRLVRLVGCVGALEAVHGVFEGFGLNFWMTPAGRWLMGAGDSAPSFNFSGTNMAYGTVFQPNHYGMLMAMLTMLALGMIAAETGAGWRLFWTANFVLGTAAVVFSNSRTALAVCAVLFVVRLFAALPAAWRRERRVAAGAAPPLAVLAACALFFAAVGLGLVDAGRFGGAVRGLGGRIAATFTPDATHRLEFAAVRGNGILAGADGETFELVREGRSAWTAKRSGSADAARSLRFSPAAAGWRGADIPGMAEGRLRVADGGAVVLDVGGETLWYFARGDRIFAVDHKGWLYGERPASPTAGLGGLERYLGGRGQTWGKALALVPDRPWLGAGPGCFALAFPNHELLMKQRHLDGVDEDKGHGVWATLLVQSGVLGVLAYGALAVCVARRRPWRSAPLGPPLTLAAAAYLLAAVTNDSTVGVTPVFCVLTGLLLSQTRETSEEKGCDAA